MSPNNSFFRSKGASIFLLGMDVEEEEEEDGPPDPGAGGGGGGGGRGGGGGGGGRGRGGGHAPVPVQYGSDSNEDSDEFDFDDEDGIDMNDLISMMAMQGMMQGGHGHSHDGPGHSHGHGHGHGGMPNFMDMMAMMMNSGMMGMDDDDDDDDDDEYDDDDGYSPFMGMGGMRLGGRSRAPDVDVVKLVGQLRSLNPAFAPPAKQQQKQQAKNRSKKGRKGKSAPQPEAAPASVPEGTSEMDILMELEEGLVDDPKAPAKARNANAVPVLIHLLQKYKMEANAVRAVMSCLECITSSEGDDMMSKGASPHDWSTNLDKVAKDESLASILDVFAHHVQDDEEDVTIEGLHLLFNIAFCGDEDDKSTLFSGASGVMHQVKRTMNVPGFTSEPVCSCSDCEIYTELAFPSFYDEETGKGRLLKLLEHGMMQHLVTIFGRDKRKIVSLDGQPDEEDEDDDEEEEDEDFGNERPNLGPESIEDEDEAAHLRDQTAVMDLFILALMTREGFDKFVAADGLSVVMTYLAQNTWKKKLFLFESACDFLDLFVLHDRDGTVMKNTPKAVETLTNLLNAFVRRYKPERNSPFPDVLALPVIRALLGTFPADGPASEEETRALDAAIPFILTFIRKYNKVVKVVIECMGTLKTISLRNERSRQALIRHAAPTAILAAMCGQIAHADNHPICMQAIIDATEILGQLVPMERGKEALKRGIMAQVTGPKGDKGMRRLASLAKNDLVGPKIRELRTQAGM
eukprot:TRINITY_DN3587_c0_g1_i3.p1 TRINITY_DN3587_c0_g1~~TRINITY_DN3587_c0_g1_i3.p1  ORF type:complete len:745 (+),score=238.81 TRINITY_DN3587_c0_g1_i3:1875-4109(+)